MDIEDKIKCLANSAKYDVSCSSSGSSRENSDGGIGSAANCGICHSWAEDGRCISLLKILFTNVCIYDCAYCINRKSNDIPRAAFTVDELVSLTLNFYIRNYIEGLFLSSGIIKSPDYTMGLLIDAVKKLRSTYNFNGYIHLKSIPGAAQEMIDEAGLYVDRLSVNIELPNEQSLKLLAPDKNKTMLIGSMNRIKEGIHLNKDQRLTLKQKSPQFVPAGQSTQLIIGATPHTDYQIVQLAHKLYEKMELKRVYYSAYIPVNQDSRLPAFNITPPVQREHRLYQADWLMRFYEFKADEIVNESYPFLDEEVDPKLGWALRHFDQFPLEINRCSWKMLHRIPGVGPQNARRIWHARKKGVINFEDLKKFGVVIKRAKYFITCNGKYFNSIKITAESIKEKILIGEHGDAQQLPLFAAL